MNIQLSSRTDEWFTPLGIVGRVHQVLGYPDLDPASDPRANQRILAKTFYTKEDNALLLDWPIGSIYLNPPGGKFRNKSLAALFWTKLMDQRQRNRLSHAIYMAFSLEQLAISQRYHHIRMASFPLVIPSRRIAFCRPDGTEETSPSHNNCIVYVPGLVDKTEAFFSAFEDLGAKVNVP